MGMINIAAHLPRNAEPEIKNPVTFTKRNAERMINQMGTNTVKHLPRSAELEIKRHVIFTKRNAKRVTNQMMSPNFVRHLKRSAKMEIKKPVIFTKRNAKRFGFSDWIPEFGHIAYPHVFNEKSKETIASECKMYKKQATYF